MNTWHEGRVIEAERLPNTVSGNPKWRLTFEDGHVFDTNPDGQISHRITEHVVGAWYGYSTNRAGLIVTMEARCPECHRVSPEHRLDCSRRPLVAAEGKERLRVATEERLRQ